LVAGVDGTTRLAAAGVIVALIVAAFVAGRSQPGKTSDNIANKEQGGARLVVAVGEHLGHSERM